MKTFVITINDIEESIKSSKRCVNSAKKVGVEVETFHAITPRNSKPVELLKEYEIPAIGFCERWSRQTNVISCFLSHYTLWLRCVVENEPFLILEHDALFVDQINKNMDYKGLLSLGAPSYGQFKTPEILGVNRLTSKEYLPGAHAYIVKPEVCVKLIERAKMDACPVDVFLHNKRFDFLEEYYPWPVVAKDSFTTVQNINGCQAKHNYAKNSEEYQII